ncbi:MAG TPA: four helix bundle protein [Vicinamibacterales bacterium]|nr:four helix bundle protein [Vicinamibacterales bacterium]
MAARLQFLCGMMGLKDFREFAAWQRAEELRVLCEAFLARPGVRDRFHRAQQLDDAAASAPRNIAEGFGRFKPRVFAQFVSIAKGSETEVLSILLEARSTKFLTASEFPKYETAAKRAIGTAVGLIRYLQRSTEPPTREP